VHPDPDPDPAFQVNPDPDTDPIRIQGFEEKKLKEVQAIEEDFSTQRKHPVLQQIKFINFFIFLWVIFAHH
jgi:hypothetical protein